MEEENKVIKEFSDKPIIIDIPDQKFEADPPNWIIYKVPNKLRKIRPAAYTPQLVSIGPLHYGKSNLKAMEHYKIKYMKEFLGRPYCNHVKEKDMIEFMEEKKLVEKIQRSYAVTFEPVNRNRSHEFKRTSSLDKADEENRRRRRRRLDLDLDFISMILRDACFIFELFFRNHEIDHFRLLNEEILEYNASKPDRPKKRQVELPDEIKNHSEDYLFKSPWLKAAIKQDLILLENQLPFLVLIDLFDFIFKQPSRYNNVKPEYLPELKNEGERLHFLKQITCEFFIDYYRFGKPHPDTEETSQKKQPPTAGSEETLQKKHSPSAESEETSQKEQPPTEDSEETSQKEHSPSAKSKETSQNKPGHKDNKDLVTELMDEKKAALKEIKHFTDLVRKFMCVEDTYPVGSEHFTHCLYSAKQLANAGVVFELPEKANYLAKIETVWDKECCWWNDQCCNRRNSCCCSWRNSCCCCWINGFCGITCLELKVPQLKVQDNTECIFRNVMALEQFVYPHELRICNYIYLLDQLISTVEDVDFLVDKRIIENWLGSNKAVVDLVNKLCDQIVTPCFFYTDICDQLNKHHGKKLNVARSTLRRVYYKDIWTGSSTFLGLVLIVFTFFSVASTIKNLFF